MQVHIPKFMNLEEVADTWGCSRATVYREVEAGRLPKPLKIGGRVRWHSSEVLAAMAKVLAERDAGEPSEALEDAWRAEFHGAPDLQAEFGGDAGRFIALKKAEHRRGRSIGKPPKGHP